MATTTVATAQQSSFTNQILHGDCVEVFLEIFGFEIIGSPVHEAALNKKLILLKIKVIQSKCRDFAHANTETLDEIDHRAMRFLQQVHDGFKLVHSDNRGALAALAAALHAHQRNRVPLLGE